jgi:hypothetical protein
MNVTFSLYLHFLLTLQNLFSKITLKTIADPLTHKLSLFLFSKELCSFFTLVLFDKEDQKKVNAFINNALNFFMFLLMEFFYVEKHSNFLSKAFISTNF